MDDLAGKTMVFKVELQPRWKSFSVVCYKEGDAFIAQVKSKFPNYEVKLHPIYFIFFVIQQVNLSIFVVMKLTQYN